MDEASPLEQQLRTLLSRRRANSTLRALTLPSPNQTDFSSNDFLSLSSNTSLRKTYLKELETANLPLGSGGSRLLDGNSTYAETLEHSIASFHGAKAGLLFNSGYDANAGFFACVPQKGDVVVYDALIHASVHDGMRLSRASSTLPFAHNCVIDLRRKLEALLGQYEEGGIGMRLRESKAHVFVAVEAVYSMDGDVVPLRGIVDVVDEVLPKGVGYVVVDEAHATGVLGPGGRGLVCAEGLERRVFARLHTFGKAVGGNGAIILGSDVLRSYLINYARPLIYSTFLSYPSLAAIRTAYNFLESTAHPPLQSHLFTLIRTLYSLLSTLVTSLQSTLPRPTSLSPSSLLTIPAHCPESPIFSIRLQEPKALASFLQRRGMMVRAVVPPTVPEGTQRVRVCLHAGNTVQEVRRLVAAIEEWCLLRMREETGEKTKRDGVGMVVARL